jgi:hypothetical protein
MTYEHPILVDKAWSRSYPTLWDFEDVEDCIALVKGVLRDRENRPEIHDRKVANCLKGKSSKDLRDDETRRVIEKGKDNEEYARMVAAMESARLLAQPSPDGTAAADLDCTNQQPRGVKTQLPTSAKDCGKAALAAAPPRPKIHGPRPSSNHLFDQPQSQDPAAQKQPVTAVQKKKKTSVPLSASAVKRR